MLGIIEARTTERSSVSETLVTNALNELASFRALVPTWRSRHLNKNEVRLSDLFFLLKYENK